MKNDRPIDLPKQIGKVYLFNDAGIAVFDTDGNQIPELQKSLLIEWAQRAKNLGYRVDGLKVELQTSVIKLIEWEFEGEPASVTNIKHDKFNKLWQTAIN